MPIYEYACRGCDHTFEELIRTASDERALRCPQCGGKTVQRRPSVFAAHGAVAPKTTPLPRGGGCGRCGDPNGPCARD